LHPIKRKEGVENNGKGVKNLDRVGGGGETKIGGKMGTRMAREGNLLRKKHGQEGGKKRYDLVCELGNRKGTAPPLKPSTK